MKTTVEISDSLLGEAKAVARREGTTVRALIEEGLRRALADRTKKPSAQGRVVTFAGRGLQAGVTFERMLELAYEGRGS